MNNTINDYRFDPRFAACRNAFIVACTSDLNGKNTGLLKENQTGHWIDARCRVQISDAIFVSLPNPDSENGYPRQLYGGVVNKIDHKAGALFSVKSFFPLHKMQKGKVRSFLNNRNLPQGNLIHDVWADNIVQDPYFESDSPEGLKRYVLHQTRERDPKIIASAKTKRLSEVGALICDVCSFDFAKTYGVRGRDFIEAHHRVPVSRLDGVTKTKVSDLDLVCSNCHRMLHKSPFMTVQELSAKLSESKPLSVPVAPHLNASTAETSVAFGEQAT